MLESIFERFDSLVVLDTETTGFITRRDEVIELATLRVTAGGEEEYDELIRLTPGRTLPPRITELTGITDEMLRRGVGKDAAARALADTLSRGERTLVAAYNAQFDLPFLYFLLDAYGLSGALRGTKFLDVMTVYKDRRPYPHRLADAIAEYSLVSQNTHRAIDDTHAAYELMCAMDDERDDLARYINLFGYNPKYGPPKPRIASVTYRPQGLDAEGRLYEG